MSLFILRQPNSVLWNQSAREITVLGNICIIFGPGHFRLLDHRSPSWGFEAHLKYTALVELLGTVRSLNSLSLRFLLPRWDVTLPDLWIENRREWLAPNNFLPTCALCIITSMFLMTGRKLEPTSFLNYLPEKRTCEEWIGSRKCMLCHFCRTRNKGKYRADCLYKIALFLILWFLMVLWIFSTESKWLVKQCKVGGWSWHSLWTWSGNMVTAFIWTMHPSAHDNIIMDLMVDSAEHF